MQLNYLPIICDLICCVYDSVMVRVNVSGMSMVRSSQLDIGKVKIGEREIL